jgi:hypothetical protein
VNIAKLPELLQRSWRRSLNQASRGDLCNLFRRVIFQFKFFCLPLYAQLIPEAEAEPDYSTTSLWKFASRGRPFPLI